MGCTLDTLFAEFDAYEERVPLDILVERLQQLTLTVEDVAEYVRFHPATYARNLLHRGPGYEALVLCWRPGQRSAIHDHTGSTCGVKNLRGIATETIFARKPSGYVYPVSTRDLEEGYVCGSQDSDIHQISNLEESRELITLHIYSPSLLRMNVFSLNDPMMRQITENPAEALMAGAGI